MVLRRHTAFSGTDQPKRALLMPIFYQSHGGLTGIPKLLSIWYVEPAFHPLGLSFSGISPKYV